MTPHQKVTITRYFDSGKAQMGTVGDRQVSPSDGFVVGAVSDYTEGRIGELFGFLPLGGIAVPAGIVGGYV